MGSASNHLPTDPTKCIYVTLWIHTLGIHDYVGLTSNPKVTLFRVSQPTYYIIARCRSFYNYLRTIVFVIEITTIAIAIKNVTFSLRSIVMFTLASGAQYLLQPYYYIVSYGCA